MNPAPEWADVRRIFEHAAELPAGDRSAYLDEACAGRPALREAVARLLHADGAAESADFLGANAIDATLADPDEILTSALVGATIGSFRVRSRLASGGMGSVFLAEQSAPRRQVALKVLKPALCTGAALRRFRVESEILARLRHPGIAAVFEAGVHALAAGKLRIDLPWYAMEYLEGARTLLAFTRDGKLDLPARLRLFAEVCAAVHHAHRMGVIHRDLKPANVLVDANGRPKVIDFGVARAIGTGLDGATLQTLPGELVGTLRYMAPEQLDTDPSAIDVRTDVYALGVILYEMLTGKPPLDVESRPITEAARILRDVEPPRPSRIVPALAGELEWIVLRALEKEPERRYASAADLGEDLLRFLRHEPLLAGPPSLRYHAWKFARRHRALVGAAILLHLALAGWTVSSRVQLHRALDAEALADSRRATAEREATKAWHAVGFVSAMFKARVTADAGAARDVDAALDHSSRALDGMFPDDPDVEAALRLTLAQLLRDRGRGADAEQELRTGLARLQRAGLEESRDAELLNSFLAEILRVQGKTGESSAVLAAAQGDDASVSIEMGYERAVQKLESGDFGGAETALRTLAERASAVANGMCLHAIVVNAQAIAVRELGRADEAERLAKRALDLEREAHGARHPHALNAEHNLAVLWLQTGRAERAKPALQSVVEREREVLGENHARTRVAESNLGAALVQTGDVDAGLALLERVEQAQRDDLGAGHRDRLRSAHHLADALLRAGRANEAERLSAEALAAARAAHPPRPPDVAGLLSDHARSLHALGRDDEAEPDYLESLAMMRAARGDAHAATKQLADALASFRAETGRAAPAPDAQH